MISTQEVRAVIAHGDVMEIYPLDPRGHSCLIPGPGDPGRPIYVVCSPKDGKQESHGHGVSQGQIALEDMTKLS